MNSLTVLIDDVRDGGDVIIRDPRVAIATLRRLQPLLRAVHWDNDMGYGFDFEGRTLLKQFLQDCQNARRWPIVYIVTSNPVARKDMEASLRDYGYIFTEGLGWTHP